MENVLVCKRENNPKRSYVLVNKYQGKHYPISEKYIHQEINKLYNRLVKNYPEILDNMNNKVIIGFAETATGIGAMFSSYFNNDKSWYVTTTREVIPNRDYVDFSEEHSHATEQRLYYEDMEEAYENDYDMIFVEDEVTTGNTIMNMILEMRTKNLILNCKNIYINSLLNGMSAEDLSKYIDFSKKIGIPVKFNYNQKIGGKAEYMEIGNNLKIESKVKTTLDMGDNVRMMNSYSAFTHDGNLDCEVRKGVKVGEYISKVDKELFAAMKDMEERKLVYDWASVRVIGTEECMYPAIRLTKLLKDCYKNLNERTHSTTRSPIVAGKREDDGYYGLSSRFKCHSLYESGRQTYLYNSLEDDMNQDLIIIVTDSKRSEAQSLGLVDLVAFYKEYCKASNIYVVRV